MFFEKPIFHAKRGRRQVLLARARAAGVGSLLTVDRAPRRQKTAGGELLSDRWLRFSPVVLSERRLGGR